VPQLSSSRLGIALLMLLLPLVALAQPLSSTTSQAVNVRAGPDPVFPVVTWLPRSEPVRIVGCLRGSPWCDVVAGRTRGWVHSRYLAGEFRARVPDIGFSVADYWSAHYQRSRWYPTLSGWVEWESTSFTPPPVPRGGLFGSR
jgi:uncharacterized protein YraI